LLFLETVDASADRGKEGRPQAALGGGICQQFGSGTRCCRNQFDVLSSKLLLRDGGHAMRLRRVVTLLTVLVVLGTLASSGSLLAITRYLHRLTGQIDSNLQSVRAAEEIQLNLLWHARHTNQSSLMGEPAFAESAEYAQSKVQDWYAVALHYVASDAEQIILERLAAELEAYFMEQAWLASAALSALDRYVEGVDPFQRAYDEAEELLQINVDQAADAIKEAEAWDTVATAIAASVAIVLVIVAATLIVGAHTIVYRPLVALRDGIQHYGFRNYAGRVSEQGTLEIREIARSFNGMAAAIERQRQSQLSFVAAVAHDLRNPLAAMKLAVRALTSVEPPTSGRQPKLVTMIARQIDVLVRMVSDLLDTACSEAGQFNIVPRPYDARDLVTHAIELFRSTSTLHTLVAHIPDTALLVNCDALRMEQVLNNLVSNAIKYSPEGGSVEVRASTTNDQVCLEVTDCGPGIPLEDREAIFEPFRRSAGWSDRIQGVGLGLSVCRRIVESHGGRIGVSSVVGRGSTFSVWLPSRAPD
jgi:signal transduction histidine kinase